MSPIDMEQLKAVRVATQAALNECTRSPVGNLLEGHLKVVLVECLLRAGYSVLEGSTRNIGKAVQLVDGRVGWSADQRPRMEPAPGSKKLNLSPDVRIWSPVRVSIELQVRSVLGAQDALFSANLADDLDRVERGVADVFILAADRSIYDAMRGIKTSPRGRKPKHPELLTNVFPDTAKLGGELNIEPCVSACARFQWFGAITRTAFGLDRIVVAIFKFV
jgi:hypothetical protein